MRARHALTKRFTRLSLFHAINLLFFSLYCFSIFWVLWQTIITSVSPELDNNTVAIRFWPKHIVFGAYQEIWSHAGLGPAFFNNVYITVVGTVAHVILCTLAGYALIKPTFPLKQTILNIIVFTMIIPGQLVMIPSFMLYRDLGLINNLNALVVSGMISGFSIILMRNYFLSIPASLSESARIDGAGELSILFRIYVPISVPGLATIIMLQMIAKWNTFYEAVLYIQSATIQPLQTALYNILNSITTMAQTGTNFVNIYGQNVVSAAIIVAMLPLMIAYPFIQRYLVKGMLVGAVKG